MGIYVYCSNPSNGARDLCAALGAVRLRNFDGLDFRQKGKRVLFRDTDTVICWGTTVPEFDGPKILNAGTRMTKLEELTTLYRSGVPCPEPTDWRRYGRERVPKTHLGRTNNHMGGSDLLLAPSRVDFIVPKIPLAEEFRIHVFDGRAIRSGKKIVRDGFKLVGNEVQWRPGENLAHPWIRSFDAGWRICYDGFKSNEAQREVAKLAVRTLGLTFGAVDIGYRADLGAYIVLEVNRAPGADPPTIEAYVRAIKRWMGTEKEKENDNRGG